MNHADPVQSIEIPPKDRPQSSRPYSILVFMLCTGLAVVMVLGGRYLIQSRSTLTTAASSASGVAVSVMPVRLDHGYERLSRHIGLVEPGRTTELGFEAGGTVTDVLVEEGDEVTRGQLIARLDTRTLEAERAASLAHRAALASDLERAELAFARQRSLEASDFAAGQSLDDARLSVTRSAALIAQVEAAIAAIDVSLDKALLRAPFDALVGERRVDEGSMVGAGTPVANLLESGALVVRFGLPAISARAVEENTSHRIIIDGTDYEARLLSTRLDLAPRTRTIDVRFELDTTDKPMPAFGQTAELFLQQFIEEPGYRVPVSALTEGDSGLWSLLLYIPHEPGERNGHVVREHIDILHTNGVHAYVKGQFPADAGIINDGTHRVVAGQRVQSVMTNP